MYEFTTMGWLKHVIFHPVEGFEDLRWKKQGSMKVALVIVFLLFVYMVADRQLTGFQFNDAYRSVCSLLLYMGYCKLGAVYAVRRRRNA